MVVRRITARSFGLFIGVLLLVILEGLYLETRRNAALAREVNEYLKSGYFTDSYNQLLWNLVQPFLVGTSFDGKLAINKPLQPDAINLYVLRVDPQKYFKVQCTCAYLGQQQTIACDACLLESLYEMLNPSREEDNAKLITESKDLGWGLAYLLTRQNFFFLQWVVGHELGHLLLRHEIGAYYFHPPSMLALPSVFQRAPSQIGMQVEQEADDFVARHLLQNEMEAFSAWMKLSDVISAAYSYLVNTQRRLRGEAPLSGDQLMHAVFAHAVTVKLPQGNEIHPPWLLRMLHFAQELIRIQAVVDRTGYFDAMETSIHQVAEEPSPPPLCRRDIPLPPPLCRLEDITPRTAPEQRACGSTVVTPPNGNYVAELSFGRIYRKISLYAQAVEEFTKAIHDERHLAETQHQAPPELVATYLERGNLFFQHHCYEEALMDWRAVLSLQPGDPIALSNLAFLSYERDQLDEAIANWRQALTSNDSLGDSWAGLAIALYAKGDKDSATAAYQTALSIDPHYASIAWLRYEAMWTEKARNAATKLLELRKTEGTPTALLRMYRWWNLVVPLSAMAGLLVLARVHLDAAPVAPEMTVFPVVKTSQPRVAYARLVCRSVGDHLLQEITFHQDDILIGSGTECDVILHDPSIARQHARIQRRRQGYVLWDLESPTGMYVNGRRINENLLKDGWIVGLGDVEFVFYVADRLRNTAKSQW